MSMSKSSYTYNRKNWEDSEFPILCETCLGNNPYLRMMKDKHGAECKICSRPFTSFRWCPGKGMRYKKTEVCQTCSKLKNVCQTCLLDLVFGLPVQVRDHALKINADMPKMGANRDFFVQNAERQLSDTDGTTPAGELATIKPDEATTKMLRKLARSQPYYNRNRAHICSFFVKGECKRGEECPYRHEKPTDPDDPLSHQNMKDRYYGSNDPVAEKLLNRMKAVPAVAPTDADQPGTSSMSRPYQPSQDTQRRGYKRPAPPGSDEAGASSLLGAYYPSQDPQRLGSKGVLE